MFNISSPIVPAIIPTSAESLRQEVSGLYFAPELHIDVTDGEFVKNFSWPYQPVGTPSEVYTDLAQFSLEVDLMTKKPFEAAAKWLEAGVDMLVFHVETTNLAELTTFREVTNVSIGVAALNDTDFSVLKPYLALADYVQIMGIATIGAQGAKFDERVFTRMKQVREAFSELPQSIDGSMNLETIPQVMAAGADRLIVGSALMGLPEDKREAAYLELTKLAKGEE